MTLGLLLFAAALCLCLLAMKASQADRLRSYSAKSNSRISAVGSAGAAGGWGSPEQKSAEIFAPAISAVMPLSLLATPAVIMAEGKTSDLGRLLNLIPLGQNKEDFLPEHDPMHAVAPVHGRPRRNSLPASVSGGLGGSGGFGGGGGRRVTTPDEAERHRIYQRGSTRRASLFSEARQELSHTFRWAGRGGAGEGEGGVPAVIVSQRCRIGCLCAKCVWVCVFELSSDRPEKFVLGAKMYIDNF